VFQFFSEAANLERLTPPELEFAILTPLPVVMAVGTLLDYRLKLFGVPFNWRTKITAWSPPDFFTDEQLRGPYRQWLHRHSFLDGPDGSTIVADDVSFILPGAPFGEAVFPMVRKQLERIFSYRQEMVKTILLN
jgi:ligand-binding SRPBCC domain-containing protein